MEIRLSRAQYERLVRIICLGKMVMDLISEGECASGEYDVLVSYIYSYAPQFGIRELIDFDEAEGVYYPSEALQEATFEIYVKFSEATFYNELAWSLADRDLVEEYGPRIGQLSVKEIQEKRDQLMERYLKEFAENGVKYLVLKRVS